MDKNSNQTLVCDNKVLLNFPEFFSNINVVFTILSFGLTQLLQYLI